jgi:hypothetical protein
LCNVHLVVPSEESIQTPSIGYQRRIFHLREKKRDHPNQPNTPRCKVAACTSVRGAHAMQVHGFQHGHRIRRYGTTPLSHFIHQHVLSLKTKLVHRHPIPVNDTIGCPCNHSFNKRDAKLTFQRVLLSCPQNANSNKKHDDSNV